MNEMGEGNVTAKLERGRLAAIFWLGISCLCWGWSFVAMPVATKAMIPLIADTSWTLLAVISTFIAWRFWLAAILYAGLNLRQSNSFSRDDIAGGLAVGLTFAGGLFLQMSGLRYALPSVSGFITSMSVIFLPLVQTFWLKRPPRAVMWIAAFLALAGLSIFGASTEPPQAEPPFRLFGELLTMCGTLFFTVQILCVDRFGAKADPQRLTLVMFVTVAAVATVVSLVIPGGISFWGGMGFAAIRHEPGLMTALLSTAVFSSALAFHLMNRYQPRVTSTMAGVVYCLEPVFATLWSLGMGMEKMRMTLACGGACIMLALVLTVVMGARGNTRKQGIQ